MPKTPDNSHDHIIGKVTKPKIDYWVDIIGSKSKKKPTLLLSKEEKKLFEEFINADGRKWEELLDKKYQDYYKNFSSLESIVDISFSACVAIKDSYTKISDSLIQHEDDHVVILSENGIASFGLFKTLAGLFYSESMYRELDPYDIYKFMETPLFFANVISSRLIQEFSGRVRIGDKIDKEIELMFELKETDLNEYTVISEEVRNADIVQSNDISLPKSHGYVRKESEIFHSQKINRYSVLGNSKSDIRITAGSLISKEVENQSQVSESKQSHTHNVIIEGIAGNISSALAPIDVAGADKKLFAKTVIEFAQTYDGVGNAKDQSDSSKNSADLWKDFCESNGHHNLRGSFGLATKFSYEYQKAAQADGYLTGRAGDESTVKNVGARLKRIPAEFNDEIISKIKIFRTVNL